MLSIWQWKLSIAPSTLVVSNQAIAAFPLLVRYADVKQCRSMHDETEPQRTMEGIPMTELLKTTCSLGTLTITQEPPSWTILVNIKRWGYDKTFSKDKVSSVSVGVGGGSILGTKTVKISLPGEMLTLKNVPSGPADYIRQVLS